MKRFIAVLSGLLVLPAFAEVAPLYYDETYQEVSDVADTEVSDDATIEQGSAVYVAPAVQSPRAGARGAANPGRTVSRAVPVSGATSSADNSARRVAATGRVTPSSRSATTQRVAPRTATTQGAMTRGAVSRSTVARPTSQEQISVTRRAMQNNNAPAVDVSRAGITQTDTVNTPLYTGRVAMRSGAVRARIPSVTASVGASTTASESAEQVAMSMDELAQITDFCKAQYTQCMDNFCNVLDDNQGRCSCSKNLKNYAKTEEALKTATEALQDVAQQIQYIGLTGDEVETLFTQTIAEETMQSKSDNSQLKNDLDKIKRLIVDVKGGTASSTETGMSFDLSGMLDFSIDSTGFDLASLFSGNQSNTNSISNQRGEQLYKTAAARCKAAVLTDCSAQGVDVSIISNAYDLEIDKQCVAYERTLTDSNEEMSRTVRNAKSVLQRARLMVAQQKNAYDLRGCINALDSCMQDDFVCGSDYENCIDPTGKYIVNGEIVVGSEPGQSSGSGSLTPPVYTTEGLYKTWNQIKDSSLNAWSNSSLTDYINDSLEDNSDVYWPVNTDYNLARFLQHKIGYNDKEDRRNYGMCMSVLNKCQDVSYNKDGTYNPANPVVREYLQRTLVQIKTMQDNLLNEYAENCLTDVEACLTQNKYVGIEAEQETDEEKTANNIAINACRPQIITCMSVNGDVRNTPNPVLLKNWVYSALEGKPIESDSGEGSGS